MANRLLSSTLEEAAISDPRQVRLIFSWFENGQCIVEIQECFNIGDMTFALNGDSTEVICTDIRTGENAVVAVIESGATNKVTFDLSRFLPQNEVSKFFELIRLNCGLRMQIARASECIDPFNPNDFQVLDLLGEITFGNYTRSAPLMRNKSDAVAIEERTTVTAYHWREAGQQNIATRGGLNTGPIVDIEVCDKKSCGGRCADDSDGCQKWVWVQEDGIVGSTTNQFFSEQVTAAAPVDGLTTFTGPATTITCAPRDQLLVTDSAGVLWQTSLGDVLDGEALTWTALSVDADGNALEVLAEGELDQSTGTVWYVGANASLYQYDPALQVMTVVQTIPGLTVNFTDIDLLGDIILITGEDGTLIRSVDGGDSFQLVVVIDPDTGLEIDIAIDLTAAEVSAEEIMSVGTSDGRVLCTLDDGVTWYSQLISGNTSPVTDIEYDPIFQQIGFMTKADGTLWKTYYGPCCEEWLEMPETTEELPENNGLQKVVICPEDINMVVAAGENIGGAGLIFVGTTEKK